MYEERRIERQSLCRVLGKDHNGQRWLKRLGDIQNGIIEEHEYNEEEPKIFDNRKRIYWKNGPEDEGFVGVWNWSAIPNKNGEDKDYVESYYDASQRPIEIILLPQVNSAEKVVECLKEGISKLPTCELVLFSCKLSNNEYEGVLCEKTKLEISDTGTEINADVTSLPVYWFRDQSIHKTKTQLFYKYMNLGIPDRKVLTRLETEVIKEVILRHASWSVAKQYSISKNNWKLFREFVGNISDESMYQEICGLLACGEDEARRYVDEFITQADSAVEMGDIERSVLVKIINNNVELKTECERIAEKNWQKNNQEKIKTALDELKKLKEEIAIQEREKESSIQDVKKEKQKLEQLLENIAQYETVEKNIKAKVQKKIEDARDDIAEFVSQIVVFSSGSITASTSNASSSEEFYICGSNCYEGEISTYEEAIESIEDELCEAGIEGRYIISFASYLFSAYMNNSSILLAGPNGESIANAFSVAMFGKYAGILDCSQKYSRKIIADMLSSDDQVVIVKNPFNTDWLSNITGLLSEGKKFYFVLNTFAEDLVIEPKGLFNYVLPFFTETIVNNVPRNKFMGKIQSADFKNYEKQNEKPVYAEYLRKVNAGKLLTRRIQSILTDLHHLDKDADSTVDYMYLFFPYAYVTGNGAEFANKVNREKNIDDEKREYMLNYLGENQ